MAAFCAGLSPDGAGAPLISDNWPFHYVRFRTDLRVCGVYLESTKRESHAGAWGIRQAGTSCPWPMNVSLMEIHMNWDRIQGNWKQVVGKAKAQWGKLTDDDLDVVAGRRDQLAGRIQERYGIAKDEVEKQISDWELKATDAWFVKEVKRS
jgi:uncharacterized protein YjbJ (UPF0337 family)